MARKQNVADAIERAKEKVPYNNPSTTVYELIDELERQIIEKQ